jgi:hypothetical protein
MVKDNVSNQDPLIQILRDEIRDIRAQLNRLQNNSVRSEITGAFSRVNFVDLPTAGIPGRVFWVLDIEDGMLYMDTGVQWVPIGGSFLVFAVGDNGAFVNPGVVVTGVTEIPTSDPGWATCATINMTPPNVYVKFFVNGAAYSVPGWST